LTIPFTKTFYVSTGADISQTMVNYARQKYSDEKRLSYIVLDIETSELPNDQIEKYDNVISMYCLHWCNDMWYLSIFSWIIKEKKLL